jgi:2-hydroxycyclohexanecarboxyl-CoA dehydrogenase
MTSTAIHSDRVVIVTGAAAGIGLGIAQRFARDGHPTVMLDTNEELLEQEAEALRLSGARVLTSKLDVASREQTEAAYAKVRETFGPISIVMANAGISVFQPFMTMTAESWQRTIDVNLTGMFHTIQAAAQDMIDLGWGRIVTISSQAALSGGPKQVHYSASKGGVVSMTRALAREFGPHGITVNTVPPSLVDTPQARRSEATGEFPPLDIIAQQMIPIPRPGVPEDIANACAFLASEQAGYVTGQILAVNGGMNM